MSSRSRLGHGLGVTAVPVRVGPRPLTGSRGALRSPTARSATARPGGWICSAGRRTSRRRAAAGLRRIRLTRDSNLHLETPFLGRLGLLSGTSRVMKDTGLGIRQRVEFYWGGLGVLSGTSRPSSAWGLKRVRLASDSHLRLESTAAAPARASARPALCRAGVGRRLAAGAPEARKNRVSNWVSHFWGVSHTQGFRI